MSKWALEYINQKYAEYQGAGPDDPGAFFALPALKGLMMSDAYKRGDLGALKALAWHLRDDNLHTIALARQHPDAFHENVIHSRERENEILEGVMRLCDQPRSRAG